MIEEVDYNHPDHPDQKLKQMLDEIKSATSIEVEDDGALVIYLPNEANYPRQKWMDHMDSTQKRFKDIFPDTNIVVTSYQMNFTTITKKQVFSEKLAGNI